MRTEQLLAEIEKISVAVAKAASDGGLTAIERDIVLGRLRVAYDAVLSLPAVASSPKEERSGQHPVTHITDTEADGECVSNSETSLPEQGAASAQEYAGETSDGPVAEKETEISMDFTLFSKPPVNRDIIESLYGDGTAEAKEEPAAEKEDMEAPSKEVTVSETISRGGIIFNETVTAPAGADLASLLSSGQVSDIRQLLGLNDRFLLIQELFNNEPEFFDEAMSRLNEFTDIDDAYIYIQENFPAAPGNVGFALLVSALERKLG